MWPRAARSAAGDNLSTTQGSRTKLLPDHHLLSHVKTCGSTSVADARRVWLIVSFLDITLNGFIILTIPSFNCIRRFGGQAGRASVELSGPGLLAFYDRSLSPSGAAGLT
jgi:hypothetical protein